MELKHFHNGYYVESEKNNCCIEDCLHNYLFCDDFISNSDNADKCPYTDASDFLNGSCNIFAIELHNQFGYDIYETKMQNGTSPHWYNKVTRNNCDFYIDVRGITQNFNELIDRYTLNPNDLSEPEKVNDWSSELSEPWYETGLLFAKYVIDSNRDYYSIDTFINTSK